MMQGWEADLVPLFRNRNLEVPTAAVKTELREPIYS